MRGRALLLALLLTGCLGAATDPSLTRLPEGSVASVDAPVTAIHGCGGRCWEPGLAEDGQGRVLVANGFGGQVVALGASPPPVDLPLLPVAGPTSLGGAGDALVQAAPDGRIWFSALDGGQGGANHAVRLGATADGGKSWDPLLTVPLPGDVDRQWLSFGPRGEVYLSWNGMADGLRFARSTDGGRTFSDAVSVAREDRIAGPPVVLPDGRIVLPHFHGAAPAVSMSDDGGATWRLRQVSGIRGDFFPSLELAGSVMRLAWRASSGDALVSESRDRGETWGAPVAWSRAGERLSVSPALAGGALAYWTSSGDLRVVLPGPSRALVAGQVPSGNPQRVGNADFAVALALREGGYAVAWADGDAVKVAFAR